MKFALKLTKPDGKIRRAYPASKTRAASILRMTTWMEDMPTWTEVDLTVTYLIDGREIGDNRGTYRTVPEALAALAAFTEPDITLITELALARGGHPEPVAETPLYIEQTT